MNVQATATISTEPQNTANEAVDRLIEMMSFTEWKGWTLDGVIIVKDIPEVDEFYAEIDVFRNVEIPDVDS